MKPYLIEIAFFTIFLVVTTLRAALPALRRRFTRNLMAGDLDELMFHECGVSAFSDNDLLGGLRNHHKNLEVVLTRSELWLRAGAGVLHSGNEERLCSIVLNSIRSISPQGKFIKISVLTKNGLSDALVLRLSDRRGFLEQLNALVLPEPYTPLSLRLFRRSPEQETQVEP